MTTCFCGEAAVGSRLTRFLCDEHLDLVPAHLLDRYDEAAARLRRFRGVYKCHEADAPADMLDRVVRAWRACRSAAARRAASGRIAA